MSETKQGAETQQGKWFTNPLFLVFVGAVLGTALTVATTLYFNRLRNFQYVKSTSSGIVKTPELNGKNLKLLLDNRPIENVSTATISVFNPTDQDFDEVPIEVKFIGDGKTKPILIQPKILQAPEAYEEVKLADTGDNSLRLGYKLKVANRSNKSVFYAEYIFEGDKAPTVEVYAQKKGVGLQEVSLADLTGANSQALWFKIMNYVLYSIGVLVVSIGAIGATVGLFTSLRSKANRKQNLERIRPWLEARRGKQFTLTEFAREFPKCGIGAWELPMYFSYVTTDAVTPHGFQLTAETKFFVAK